MGASGALTFGSLFSGAGLMDHALEKSGWTPLFQCEIDRDARRVLAARWPGVDCHDDIQTLDPAGLPPVRLLAGGFPCQDVSLAGKRAGLAGKRSGLFFHFVRLADALAPRWLLVENVPGLLSSNHGEDFAWVLEGLTGCRPQVPDDGWRNAGFGYGPRRALAWRVLDAQSVGGCALHVAERGRGPVPQRRRRVFLVACSGDVGGLGGAAPRRDLSRLVRLPVQVLFEPESEPGHLEAGRTEEAGTAATPEGGAPGSLVSHALTRRWDSGEDGTGRGTPLVSFNWKTGGSKDFLGVKEEGAGALHASQTPAIAYQCHGNNVGPMGTVRAGNGGLTGGVPFVAEAVDFRNGTTGDTAPTVQAGAVGHGPSPGTIPHVIQAEMTVRRLTPTECLRLQGAPADFLDLAPPLSDSAKYRLCGNGVALPPVDWIGRRLAAVDQEETP